MNHSPFNLSSKADLYRGKLVLNVDLATEYFGEQAEKMLKSF